MSAKARKPTRGTLAWAPYLAELFLMTRGMEPPAAVTVFRSADGRRFTLKGRFKCADGAYVTATTRLRRDDHAGLVRASDTLEHV